MRTYGRTTEQFGSKEDRVSGTQQSTRPAHGEQPSLPPDQQPVAAGGIVVRRAPRQPPTPAAAHVNLSIATIGFALTFWSWNLIAPLASTVQTNLHFSSFALIALIALPLVIGSLGRIPVGALTDRFGAKLMFPLLSTLSIVPTLLLIPANGSYSIGLRLLADLALAGALYAASVMRRRGDA